MEGEQQSNAQQVEQQQQGEQKSGEQKQVEQQEGKTFTQAEWDARQKEFDAKADKIRKNATRETERRVYRDMAHRGGQQGQQGQQGEQQQQQRPQAEELKEPKRDDFENYEAYLEARADYAGKKASRDERAKIAKEESEQRAVEQRAETDKAFKKHADAATKEIPDFAEVISEAEDVMITETMGDAIKEEGPLGPHILYWLVKNPEQADRIAGLKSMTAQAKEIGKIAAQLESERKAKAGAQQQGAKGDDEQQGDDTEGKGKGESQSDGKGDAEGKLDRGDDGRFQAQGKKKAPDPIEPIAGRRTSQDAVVPSDKDDINTWMDKRVGEVKRAGHR